MDLLAFLIVVCIIVLVVATAVGRVDWFHALIAVVALIVLWYVLAGGADLTLHRAP